jgi:hypothetical protein
VTRFLAAVTLALVLTACGGSSDPPPPTAPSVAPSPAQVPDGVPPSFEDDVAAENVPTPALIPQGAAVTQAWTNQAGDAIAVAWESPGGDPFRRDRGVAVWRRFHDGGAPWRPVWGQAFPAGRDEPVLGVDARFADVTGDSSADALVFASLGGSGACTATWVIDVAAGAQAYRDRGCDRVIEASSDPVGLRIREAVYAPGDPHCCPSGFRETILVYDNGAWRAASSSVSPA